MQTPMLLDALAAYARAEDALDVDADLPERDAARERYREQCRRLLAQFGASATLRTLGPIPLAE